MPKVFNFGEFLKKTKACGQTVLPDRSILKGQKMVENAKIETFKCDILSNIQTLCRSSTPYILYIETAFIFGLFLELFYCQGGVSPIFSPSRSFQNF